MLLVPNLESVRAFLKYGDWANDMVLLASTGMSDAQLDTSQEMGPGSLRKTIKHICDGEAVWLQRWMGKTETPWPPAEAMDSIADLAEVFRKTRYNRNAFLATCNETDLIKSIVYRDSKGSLFSASLGDMMLQLIIHSTHHRAQAVNMIRRLGGGTVELDYMMWVRQSA